VPPTSAALRWSSPAGAISSTRATRRGSTILCKSRCQRVRISSAKNENRQRRAQGSCFQQRCGLHYSAALRAPVVPAVARFRCRRRLARSAHSHVLWRTSVLCMLVYVPMYADSSCTREPALSYTAYTIVAEGCAIGTQDGRGRRYCNPRVVDGRSGIRTQARTAQARKLLEDHRGRRGVRDGMQPS
jgi:hypothetical protein